MGVIGEYGGLMTKLQIPSCLTWEARPCLAPSGHARRDSAKSRLVAEYTVGSGSGSDMQLAKPEICSESRRPPPPTSNVRRSSASH